ncbi:hypothetical protein GCM10011391_05620 [Pullulanibacillus camelliae]|uniref:Uncharacterized protein n=1 Tax=Pullulanibacillus camelliae TaxID=1707096 RepID=A0A8J2VLH8_9BACL|nr:hypothetical protein GCM10011391_05620 [Pullulanibacillus camelliae]
MLVGGVTVIFWLNIHHLPLPHFMDWAETNVYEMIPGFILSLIAVILVSLWTRAPEQSVTDQFADMENKLREDTAPIK